MKFVPKFQFGFSLRGKYLVAPVNDILLGLVASLIDVMLRP
jgi:hypothetical protein